jgi:WD40 repeat protein
MHAPVRDAEVPPAAAIRNPYVGLRPYSKDHRDIFFGRARDAELLINKIFSGPLTILYAPSGVGKTSLLRTLVVPDIADPLKYDAHVIYHDSYAEAKPEQMIYAALGKALGGDASLSNGSTWSAARVKPLLQPAGRTTVLILDQFEEFLQRHGRRLDPLRRDLANLVRAGLNLHVVLSFREEFLAALDACFREYILTIFASTYHLEHLNTEAATAAITRPAQKFGVTYEPALLKELLKELQAEPETAGYTMLATRADSIDLPFLQIVCSRLWSESFLRGTGKEYGGTIMLETFRKLGARRGIVEKYVQEVTAGFSFRERAAAARLLGLLAPESGMKMGYPPDVLSQQTKLSQRRVQKLLAPLVTRGIVRVRDTQSGQIYELSHDAFIKVLRPWVEKVLHLWWLWRVAQCIGSIILVALIVNVFYHDRGCVVTAAQFTQRAKAVFERDPLESLNMAIDATTYLDRVYWRHWPGWLIPPSSDVEVDLVLRRAAARAQGGWVLKQARTESETLAAAFSPDEKAVLLGREDGTMHLINAERGSTVHPLKLGNIQVSAFTFSYDGKLMAVASTDGKVRVWRTDTGIPNPMPYELDHSGVNAIAVNADTNVIVTGGEDKLAVLWDASTGHRKATSTKHLHSVVSVAVSADGKHIATGSGDGVTRLWDEKLKLLHNLKGHDSDVVSIDFSADGRQLVTAGLGDEKAHVWEIVGEPWKHFELVGHSEAINTVQFDQSGSNFIITASVDRTVRVWDSMSGRQVAHLPEHTNEVSHAAFSPNGKRIVTVGKERTVRLWDFDMTWTTIPRAFNETAPSMTLSNGDRIEISPKKVVIINDQIAARIALFEVVVTSDQIAAQMALKVTPSNAASVAYESRTRLVATGGEDGVVRLWSADTKQGIAEAKAHEMAISSLAFSHDGTRLVSAGGDGTVIVWSWKSAGLNHERRIKVGRALINRAAFSPDDKHVVTASVDGNAQVWSIEDESQKIDLHDPTESVLSSLADATFSPDGKLVATAGFDGRARIYDARTGELISKLPGAFPLSTVHFITKADRTLIETYSGRLTAPPNTKSGWRGAQFSPHGRLEIVKRNDQKMTYDCEIWCKPREAVIEFAKRHKMAELGER